MAQTFVLQLVVENTPVVVWAKGKREGTAEMQVLRETRKTFEFCGSFGCRCLVSAPAEQPVLRMGKRLRFRGADALPLFYSDWVPGCVIPNDQELRWSNHRWWELIYENWALVTSVRDLYPSLILWSTRPRKHAIQHFADKVQLISIWIVHLSTENCSLTQWRVQIPWFRVIPPSTWSKKHMVVSNWMVPSGPAKWGMRILATWNLPVVQRELSKIQILFRFTTVLIACTGWPCLERKPGEFFMISYLARMGLSLF